MVSALRELRVDAYILTTNDHGPNTNPELPIGRWFDYKHVPVIAFDRWSPAIPAIREFAVAPSLTRWLQLNICNYDLLHIHAIFSYPSTLSMLQARLHKKPYILRTIGQLSPYSLARSSLRKRCMLSMIENANIASASALHYTTNLEQQEAVSLGYETPSFVLPLGVHKGLDLTRSHLAKNSDTLTFLFLSRIHPKKNLHLIISALSILQKRCPDLKWKLLIAGEAQDPHYLSLLKDQIIKLSLASNCVWLGFVQGNSKWELLSYADWFLLPSASENFGISVAEALSVGTPAIVTSEVAISNLINSYNAGIVTNSEPHALAFALEKAARAPKISYTKSAQNLVEENFSWPLIAASLKKQYKEVLLTQRTP